MWDFEGVLIYVNSGGLVAAAGAVGAAAAGIGVYRMHKRKKLDLNPFSMRLDNFILENPMFDHSAIPPTENPSAADANNI